MSAVLEAPADVDVIRFDRGNAHNRLVAYALEIGHETVDTLTLDDFGSGRGSALEDLVYLAFRRDGFEGASTNDPSPWPVAIVWPAGVRAELNVYPLDGDMGWDVLITLRPPAGRGACNWQVAGYTTEVADLWSGDAGIEALLDCLGNVVYEANLLLPAFRAACAAQPPTPYSWESTKAEVA